MTVKANEPMNNVEGLIDLHAHIVPGVDDGSSSDKESLKMLQIAEADGIECIVATPHVFSKLNSVRDVESILEKKQEFLDRIKLFDFRIQVLPGSEVFFTTNLGTLLQKYDTQLTLNSTPYFILEFPFDFIFPGIHDFIFNILMDGRIPVIAHPERNQVIQRNPGILFQMVRQGVLTQINAGSLLGSFGPEAQATAFLLVQNNLAHVVASDAHSMNNRTPRLSSAYSLLADKNGEKSELLFKKIPRAILNDEQIPDIGEPLDPRKRQKFF
jgi:protein-tyrosine phosphatase